MADNYKDTAYRMYESTTHILNDSTLANEINKEIEKLMGIILKMEVDGVIG